MNTIILDGSPKPDPKSSGTNLFCNAFIEHMQKPCELRRIAGSDYAALAQYIRGFDEVILIMPLYVHAVPGMVKKFFEVLQPVENGKKFGFIIQQGFSETAQSKYVTPYLKRFAERLNYEYLGTAVKGECAGVVHFPKAFEKTLAMVRELGMRYEQTGVFDTVITASMAKPYELSKKQVRFFIVLTNLGLTNFFWHQKLKENHAMDRRLDRPFI